MLRCISNFVLLFFLAFISCPSQTNWYFQNPIPTGNDLLDVRTFNSLLARITTSDGTILQTSDGGLSWSEKSIGHHQRLWGISFADINIGFAVGEQRTILYTTDGGNSWTTQSFCNCTGDISYTAVACPDADTAIVVGGNGTILHTTNGGSNWITQSSGTVYDPGVSGL